MNRVRIIEIAHELGLTSREVVISAIEIGYDVEVANSSITLDEADKLVNYILHDSTTSFKKPQMVRVLNSLSVDMIRIEKGSFLMGEGDNQKKVTIENDFYIGKYPVTVAEYLHFAKDIKKRHPKWLEEGSKYNIETGTDHYYKKMQNLTNPNAPIVGISWYDAKAYCEWLSEKRKEEFRLPTEVEWEYACRAGTTTKWSFGDDEKELEKYAWYYDNSDGTIQQVGKNKPNPWGLYDMHGNVWEWCEDWNDEDEKYKVLRGGSWGNGVLWTRSADRRRFDPFNRFNSVGFRLLRTLPS